MLDPAKGTALVSQVVMAGYATHSDPQFRNYRTVTQPQTYAAYREFRAGVELWAEKTSTDSTLAEAARHLRRAADLDSGLVLARAYLALMYSLQGRCDAVDSVVTATRASQAALLSTERAMLQWVRSWCQSDALARYEAGVQLQGDAPDYWEYAMLHALAAAYSNRPREALTTLQGLKVPSSEGARSWYLNITMHAMHHLGQYREALQAVEQARRELPNDPMLDRYAMRQWAALGDLDGVGRVLVERERKSSAERWAGEDMLFVGGELRGHGFGEAGRDMCDRAARWYGARPADEQATRGAQSGLARSFYCAEQWEDARTSYERLAASDSADLETQTRLGALAVRRGDSATAERIDGWLVARGSRPGALYGRAVLSALRGDRERAVVLLQQAWERGPNFPGAHIDPDLERLHDLPAFHALLYPDR